jgi:hypothetical protein
MEERREHAPEDGSSILSFPFKTGIIQGVCIMDKRKKGHINKTLSFPKGSRKIHIGDEIWRWKSTDRSVVIKAPNGKKNTPICKQQLTSIGYKYYLKYK